MEMSTSSARSRRCMALSVVQCGDMALSARPDAVSLPPEGRGRVLQLA